MRVIFTAAIAFAFAAACAPPADTTADTAETPTAADDARDVAADLGPYTNSWNADEFSRFSHTLHAPAPGEYQLTLSGTTDSPGGETVAVYPVGPDGAPLTTRIMFVVVTTHGEAATENVTIPAEGLPVVVTVENASGRRLAGEYTLIVAPVP